MRKGSIRLAFHAPSQPHSDVISNLHTHAVTNRALPIHARRGFSLAETLVALVVTALVVSLGAAMVHAVATVGRTLPVQGARAASDARVEAMIGELRNAVAITQISPTQVTAVVNTAGNAAAATTVNGTATGQYAVSYEFGSTSGSLYRNGGGTARFGAAGGVSPKLPTLGGLPTPPTAPSVNPPGAQPSKPSCSSPCYNPSGAYAAYTNYSASGTGNGGGSASWYYQGGTAYPVYSGSATHSGSAPYSGGCGFYWEEGTGNGLNQPGLSASHQLSNNPSSESYLGMQSTYCDFTRNGPMINGGYMAVRFGRHVYNAYYTAIYYVPITSQTTYYYLPSCSCYLSQSGYNADVTNWNNYQNALNTYNQQMAKWQGAKNQWGTYNTSYNAYAGKVTKWNIAAQNAVVNTTAPSGKPGTVTTTQWNTTTVWQLVADRIQSLTFTGYDQNMQPTTGAGNVRVLGIKVQYPGQPAEEEQIALAGTPAFLASISHPLTIPPAGPDPRGPSPWPTYDGWHGGHGIGNGGLGGFGAAGSGYGGIGTAVDPDTGTAVSVQVGTVTGTPSATVSGGGAYGAAFGGTAGIAAAAQAMAGLAAQAIAEMQGTLGQLSDTIGQIESGLSGSTGSATAGGGGGNGGGGCGCMRPLPTS